MPVGLYVLAYAVRKNSNTLSSPIGLGHAQQLLAAALGYKSLAAYQAAQAAGQETDVLDDVAHVLLHEDVLVARAAELGVAGPENLPRLVSMAFKSVLPGVRIANSESDLQDDVRLAVEWQVENDPACAGQMVGANHDGVDETYVELEFEFGDVPDPGNALSVDVAGQITLRVDRDRPYSGHRVKFKGGVFLERLGRTLLAKPRFEAEHAILTGYDDV